MEVLVAFQKALITVMAVKVVGRIIRGETVVEDEHILPATLINTLIYYISAN